MGMQDFVIRKFIVRIHHKQNKGKKIILLPDTEKVFDFFKKKFTIF